MKRMMMGGAVLAAGVMAVALPPVLGAQASPSSASAAVHPSAAEILTRSTTAMAAVHRTHSEGTAYLWASGTNGNHIPSSTRVRVTGDCTIKRTSRRVVIRTRFHAVGEHTVGGRLQQHLDWRYITVVRGGMHASSSAGQSVRVWERDARTYRRWRSTPSTQAAQHPAYFLGYTDLCPSDLHAIQIAPARFTYLGATRIYGVPVWHIRGMMDSGDTTSLDLFVDQASFHWLRVISTFIVRNNGAVVNRLRWANDYSQFNGAIRISPPTIGATTP